MPCRAAFRRRDALWDDAGVTGRGDSDTGSSWATLFGRGFLPQSLSVVMLMGLGLVVAGLEVVRVSSDWGFTYGGAVVGILSQLATTGPAAVLVGVAVSANILVGAIALRLAGQPVFHRLSDLVLGGFAAAVAIDAAALFLLGSAGLFGWPELVLLHLAIAVPWLVARPRPALLAGPLRPALSRPLAWWLLVLAVWAGPLLIQLASPAAPFQDVLPNHVAPVEHVRMFGSFATLTTSPSPIYGPSRLMLGYVALLGQLTTITNLDAILADAAFALPLTILAALAVRRLAGALFGGSASFWILLTFPLTFTFVRIPDARGTVVVFPLAAWALALVAEQVRDAGARARMGKAAKAEARARGLAPRPRHGTDLALGLALGGAFLLHPLVGLVGIAAVCGALILYPAALGRRVVPALGCAALMAVPQVLTMAGIEAPGWIGFVFVAAAVAALFLLDAAASAVADRLRGPALGGIDWRPALVTVGIGAVLLVARSHISPPDDPATELPTDFLLLVLLCLAGAALGALRSGRGWVVLGCGTGAGLAAWAASGLVGFNGLTEQAVHYEVPKSVEYWLPVMLALGAAGFLAGVMRLSQLGVVRPLVAGLFVVVSVYPITSPLAFGPLVIDSPAVDAPLVTGIKIGVHRDAESLGLALREAELGYWLGYPDSRTIIDAPRRAVVDELRSEIAAGRLTASTKVLHIADSFQQWASVPIGVFTGALETSISSQPEVSIHTEGGRLLGFGDLNRELGSAYGYVVLEPANLSPGLVSSTQAAIAAAGYRQIWANSQATVYYRG